MKYNFADFEEKWQQIWERERTFEVSAVSSLPKYYCLEMFLYPSGGIHMGHLRNYAIGDVVARYKFMRGFNVLHPVGWDAFGLPAENAAKQNNRHPAEWTYDNIKAMRTQLKSLGLSYDWSREITTCDPEYYKWEQQFFIRLWERGLAYKKRSRVNWCAKCETVLANEQVEDGKCWRCASAVKPKELEQWFLKITDYADELLESTYNMPGWPEKVLTMQRNWIGKSIGAEIDFDILNHEGKLTVFSTRPDTLYGATFMLIAPEHPIAKSLIAGQKNEAEGLTFIKEMENKSKDERMEDKEKRGFFTGQTCMNPATLEQIPIYIANYVLMDYGTGAVMAVPAHDQRDFEFAKKYKLPIIDVISSDGEDHVNISGAYEGEGRLVNSDRFDGMINEEAKEAIVDMLIKSGDGRKAVSYRLRDWGVSRQRYWGAPVPFIHCEKCGTVPVPDNELPVLLPENVRFDVTGNPLDSVAEFVNTKCPKCGENARRETHTMDTFIESSWYFLRFCSPRYNKGMFDKNEVAYWMPVDQYIGGVEHAVMHLLYARFFTKVLRDMGYLNFDEPFTNLLTQGMVCKETFSCLNCGWLYPNEVKDGVCAKCGAPVTLGRVEKMSKSKKNVVDPTELLKVYGADTLRLFSLFVSPPDKEMEWSESGVEGCYRFVNRVFRLISANIELLRSDILACKEPQGGISADIIRHTNSAVRKVTTDVERFNLNTAVAAIMEYVNSLYGFQDKLDDGCAKGAFKDALFTLINISAPFIPHVAEELWLEAGGVGLVSRYRWPTYNEKYILQDNIIVVVQVNGKVRAELTVPRDSDEKYVTDLAMQNVKIKEYTDGKNIVKKVYVPGKLVSLVVK